MEPVQKGSDSPNQNVDFRLSASENTPDEMSSARTGTESLQIELDLSKDQSMKGSFGGGDPSMSESSPVIGSEFTEESEAPHAIDPNDSLGEIREDLFGKSEVLETRNGVMSGESQSFSEQGGSSKVELQSRENLSNQSKKQNSNEFVSNGGEREKPKELSVKKLRKDQYCQADSLRENSKSNEVQILKEKLAVSKKDTKTMQKLLEDVRKDYEDLQKNFEKRENEARNKEFAEEMTKESSGIIKEKAEVKRKAPKKEWKSSDELRSLELDKPKTVKATNDMTCPCFAQSFRKIVTDVTEDFKETIWLIKQSSQEEKERITKELAQLKDEYKCALEKKDSEIHAVEEIIKGLLSRIRESEREVVSFRDAVSSAYEEKIGLYDDIRALKDKLANVERDGETSRASLERIKHGLKKFCTAEEYEELEHQNFKFSDCGEVEGSLGERSESDENLTEVHDKLAKFHPVLKKAKKEITQLKEQKLDAENSLREKVSQATEKEKQLCKKLKKALSDLKQSQSDTTGLSKQLEALKLENTRLNTGSDELEGQLEDLRRGYAQELRTVNDKLKISNDKLMHSQEKYNQLQEENKILRDDYDDLKSFVEEMNGKKMKDVVIDCSDNDDLSEQLIKDESSLKKQLKVEKDRNEKFQNEIQLLKKDVDLWRKIAADEWYTGGVGYLKIENEELKQEIEDHQTVIRQLISKKKEHVRIINKLRTENSLLKGPCNASEDRHEDLLLESEDELESDTPDTTSTQEHRIKFDKNGKMEDEKQTEFFDEEEDSLFVQFMDDNGGLHKVLNLAEILEYDTSVSEKE